MSATSHSRGNEIYYVSDDVWKYSEDDSIYEDNRLCKRCGHYPNEDGSDFCIGHIDGVTSACCGHGVEEPYVVLDSGKYIRGEAAKKYFKR